MLSIRICLTIALLLLASGRPGQGEVTGPEQWVEPETGHRVVRLSRDPGSASLYFHQNGYTASGDKLLISTSTGLSTINLKDRKIDEIVVGRVTQIVVGRNSRRVFYTRDGAIYTTHLDTRQTREIARLPATIRPGSGLTVNADETLLGGSVVDSPAGPIGDRDARQPSTGSAQNTIQGAIPANQESNLEARWARRLPMRLFTVSIRTGEFRTFHPSTDWLNHVQF